MCKVEATNISVCRAKKEKPKVLRVFSARVRAAFLGKRRRARARARNITHYERDYERRNDCAIVSARTRRDIIYGRPYSKTWTTKRARNRSAIEDTQDGRAEPAAPAFLSYVRFLRFPPLSRNNSAELRHNLSCLEQSSIKISRKNVP